MTTRHLILALSTIALLAGCASGDPMPTERPSVRPSRTPPPSASIGQVQSGQPSRTASAATTSATKSGRSPGDVPTASAPASTPTATPATPAASAPPAASASPSTAASEPPAASETPTVAPTATGAPNTGVIAAGSIDPADFTSTVDNPWFPLTPGTKLTYHGSKDGKAAIETFTVASATRVIAGVTCAILEDKVSLNGVAAERLVGYYAQDRAGNVWYFGEDTGELDANGDVVKTGPGWHAGVDNAPASFFMEAAPAVDHSFVNGYTRNDFAFLSLSDAATVPYGSFKDVVVSKEWSPLEPDVEVHKSYARGVGLIRDLAVKGPTEELALVSVEHQ